MAKKEPQEPSPQVDAGVTVITQVLEASEPRPSRSDPVGAKNQYAVRFADHMATQVASDLFERLEDISATTKRTADRRAGRNNSTSTSAHRG